MRRIRKPLPIAIPGGSEVVNRWLQEWAQDRNELEEAERRIASLEREVAVLSARPALLPLRSTHLEWCAVYAGRPCTCPGPAFD